MERLREQRPDQYDFFSRMTGFDPITGASVQQMSALPSQAPAPVSAAPRMRSDVQAFLDSQAKYRDEGSRMPTGRGSAAPAPSGGFDPLGPSGNYSLDFSEAPIVKLFGKLTGN